MFTIERSRKPVWCTLTHIDRSTPHVAKYFCAGRLKCAPLFTVSVADPAVGRAGSVDVIPESRRWHCPHVHAPASLQVAGLLVFKPKYTNSLFWLSQAENTLSASVCKYFVKVVWRGFIINFFLVNFHIYFKDFLSENFNLARSSVIFFLIWFILTTTSSLSK